MTIRKAIPENNGKPAISCAIPTVNGFITGAENPTDAPRITIAKPVIASNPRATASGARILHIQSFHQTSPLMTQHRRKTTLILVLLTFRVLPFYR